MKKQLIIYALSAFFVMACHSNDDSSAECGNGKLEAGEACDGQNMNGNTCANRYGMHATGQVVCDPTTCQVRYDDCRPDAVGCGNGIVDAGEDCDGENIGTNTCATFFEGATGSLKCTASCRFDYSACQIPDCGNGRLDDGESCDPKLTVMRSCSEILPKASGELSCNHLCQWDVSSCLLPSLGDRCHVSGELNNGGCDAQGRHYYCKNGVTFVDSCNLKGEALETRCVVLDKGNGNSWSGCVDKRDACDNPGKIARRCNRNENHTYTSSRYVCTKDQLTGKSYWLLSDDPQTEVCPVSCIEETGACGRLTPDEGTPCNDTGDDPNLHRCDGNIAVNCFSRGNDEVITAEACSGPCVIYDYGKNYAKQAACWKPSDLACQVGDPYLTVCDENISTKLECNAILDSDTGYYIALETTECEHGCNADNGQCVQLSADEGKRCNVSKYHDNCLSDDLLQYCDTDNKVHTRICIDESGQTGHCVEMEDSAYCGYPCDVPEQTESICETIDDYSYTTTYTCTEVDDHTVYLPTKAEACYLGCTNDNSACFKFSEDDGEPCDNTMETVCDGNVVKWCNKGQKLSYDCNLYDRVCASLDQNESACYRSCDELDQEFDICMLNDAETGYETVHYICKADKKGILYALATTQTPCSKACNAERTACARNTIDPL